MTQAVINRRRRIANQRVSEGIQLLRDNAIIQDMRDYWFYLVQLRKFWMGFYGLDKLKRRK